MGTIQYQPWKSYWIISIHFYYFSQCVFTTLHSYIFMFKNKVGTIQYQPQESFRIIYNQFITFQAEYLQHSLVTNIIRKQNKQCKVGTIQYQLWEKFQDRFNLFLILFWVGIYNAAYLQTFLHPQNEQKVVGTIYYQLRKCFIINSISFNYFFGYSQFLTINGQIGASENIF